jgi:hypothetical protein
MNGRVYDPLTAQFFSPDNYIQDPGNWLNYNRYSYCINNPLRYTDPSGEVFGADDAIIIGMAVWSALYAGTETFEAGGEFWGTAIKTFIVSVATSYFTKAIPVAIGDAFGAVNLSSIGGVAKEVARAAAHGVGNGLANMMSGGSFKHGFWAGVGGSALGSVTGNSFAAGFGGAVGAYLSGGDPVRGFMAGYMIGGLNHKIHGKLSWDEQNDEFYGEAMLWEITVKGRMSSHLRDMQSAAYLGIYRAHYEFWTDPRTAMVLGILPLGGSMFEGVEGLVSLGRLGWKALVKIGAKKALTNQQLVQKSATLAEKAIGGTGHVSGTLKHSYANRLITRYQKIYGERGLYSNFYFSKGVGNRGYLDVLDKMNGIIYDYKFGNAVMSPLQYNKYYNNFGFPIQIVRP